MMTSPPSSSHSAVIVGINKYRNYKPNLQCAAQDACAIAQILEKLNFEQLRLMVDIEIADEQPSRFPWREPNQANFLLDVEKAVANLPHQGVLLLFFAGHCVQDENGAPVLFFADSDQARMADTAVTSDMLAQKIGSRADISLVVILDVCPPGEAFAAKLLQLFQAHRQDAQAILIASNAPEGQRAPLLKGRGWRRFARRSRFISCLIEALTHTQGEVRAKNVFNHALSRVVQQIANQQPTVHGDANISLGHWTVPNLPVLSRATRFKRRLEATLRVLGLLFFPCLAWGWSTSQNVSQLQQQLQSEQLQTLKLQYADTKPLPLEETIEYVYLQQQGIIVGYEDKQRKRWLFQSQKPIPDPSQGVCKCDVADGFERALDRLKFPQDPDKDDYYSDISDAKHPRHSTVHRLILYGILRPGRGQKAFNAFQLLTFGEYIDQWLSQLLQQGVSDSDSAKRINQEIERIQKLSTKDGRPILQPRPDGKLPSPEQPLTRRDFLISLARAVKYLRHESLSDVK